MDPNECQWIPMDPKWYWPILIDLTCYSKVPNGHPKVPYSYTYTEHYIQNVLYGTLYRECNVRNVIYRTLYKLA